MPDQPATAALRGQAGAAIVDLQLAHKAVDAAAGFIGAGVTNEQVAAARRALTDMQRALWPVAHASDTAAQRLAGALNVALSWHDNPTQGTDAERDLELAGCREVLREWTNAD